MRLHACLVRPIVSTEVIKHRQRGRSHSTAYLLTLRCFSGSKSAFAPFFQWCLLHVLNLSRLLCVKTAVCILGDQVSTLAASGARRVLATCSGQSLL